MKAVDAGQLATVGTGLFIRLFDQYVMPSVRVLVYDVKARNRILEYKVQRLEEELKKVREELDRNKIQRG